MTKKVNKKQIHNNTIEQRNLNIDTQTIVEKNSVTNKEFVSQSIRSMLNLYNSKLNLNMISNNATKNQLACNNQIIEFPIGNVFVKINGVSVKVGEGQDCYFSTDGTLIRYKGYAKKGDYLFWNSNDYDLDNDDEIDFNYIVGYEYIIANENDEISINTIHKSIVVKYIGDENTTMSLIIDNITIIVGNENGSFIWDKGGSNEHIFTESNEHIIVDVSGVSYTVWFDGFGSMIFSVKKGIAILSEIKYGYLYNWYITEKGEDLISIEGQEDDWRISTKDDWDYLVNNLISVYPEVDEDNVGRHLKSKRLSPLPEPRWDFLNSFYIPYDSFNFNALPGKSRLFNGEFNFVSNGNWWTTNDIGGGSAESRRMRYDSNKVNYSSFNKNSGLSIRLVRPVKSGEFFMTDGTGYPEIPLYKGNDGKLYNVAKIGNLVWVTNNLAESKWNNNNDIHIETGTTIWSKGGIEDINDWYLPSIEELELLYTNLTDNQYANFTYCSSSENSSTEYLALNFSDGLREIFNKDYSTFFITVRDFVTGNTYDIGDIGPANGWIFGKVSLGNDEYKYYESSKDLLSGPEKWSNINNISASTSELLGEGKNNTSKIINQSGHTDSLAKITNDYIYTIPYPMMCAFNNNKNLV